LGQYEVSTNWIKEGIFNDITFLFPCIERVLMCFNTIHIEKPFIFSNF